MTGLPRPNRNDPSGVQVGISGITTTCTKEFGLSTATRFINATTYRTGSTGVTWINGNHENTRESRLILNEGSQLSERPGMDDSPLAFSNRNPFTDALEVFQCNTAMSVFGLSHQSLGYAMVGISLEASLPAASPFEFALGRLGALTLEFGAKA